MNRAGGLLIGLMVAALATPAAAGAWTRPKGKAQAIFKLEQMTADEGFDPNGEVAPLPAERRDVTAGVFAEYGLTDTLTLQLKGDWQSGEDAFVDFEGRGPIEIGVTWGVWRDAKTAVSLYAGYAEGGEGRNAGYAAPGEGDSDWEARLSAGRNFEGGSGLFRSPSFIELQVARRLREGLPDETRVDVTHGVHLGENWLLLNQAYGGAAEETGARWLSVESSIVRHFGDWSVQAGWRQAIAGREIPRSGGPVVALWRRF